MGSVPFGNDSGETGRCHRSSILHTTKITWNKGILGTHTNFECGLILVLLIHLIPFRVELWMKDVIQRVITFNKGSVNHRNKLTNESHITFIATCRELWRCAIADPVFCYHTVMDITRTKFLGKTTGGSPTSLLPIELPGVFGRKYSYKASPSGIFFSWLPHYGSLFCTQPPTRGPSLRGEGEMEGEERERWRKKK